MSDEYLLLIYNETFLPKPWKAWKIFLNLQKI
jgi:hypothetical protein